MPNNGLLISIEGIDGCGKSTLAANLHKTLVTLGHKTILTKEPGGTEFGKTLRTILHVRTTPISDKSEFLLFAADRAHHFQEIVIPALKAGNNVISDRMADSSLAYQGYGRCLDKDRIKAINEWCMDGINPDIVIYIKIDVQSAFKRIYKRQETLTAFEKEQKDFWERIIAGFEEIFSNKKNIITIDGTKNPDEMLNDTLKEIIHLLKTP
jgi:dTMP kinase